MNPMVRNLLVSAIGMCKFAMLHEEHPVARAIKEFRLFEGQSLESLLERIRAARDGQVIKMILQPDPIYFFHHIIMSLLFCLEYLFVEITLCVK